ncbi:hypothetical protein J2Z65_005667 [Paenibacillus aceris]|uniref:Uncharacterized protein n=1 Tax=Paenibacillus aceris TaxID=869555 RepID=A0ABS4I670_9BACL|nr:hypothetical protein [Paenibacillus aceris]
MIHDKVPEGVHAIASLGFAFRIVLAAVVRFMHGKRMEQVKAPRYREGMV